VRVTEASQSAGEVPSPVDGNCWVRSQLSTGLDVVPTSTEVSIFVSRLRVQNDGE